MLVQTYILELLYYNLWGNMSRLWVDDSHIENINSNFIMFVPMA